MIRINKDELLQLEESIAPLWMFFNKYTIVIGVLSIAFYSCGIGHLLEAFRMWIDNGFDIVLVHTVTAISGVILFMHLNEITNSMKKWNK